MKNLPYADRQVNDDSREASEEAPSKLKLIMAVMLVPSPLVLVALVFSLEEIYDNARWSWLLGLGKAAPFIGPVIVLVLWFLGVLPSSEKPNRELRKAAKRDHNALQKPK